MTGGGTVKILQANTSRYDGGDITWNDAVFFWFDETAPVVLTQ
jgi:putrescine transport system ATP-binding protein